MGAHVFDWDPAGPDRALAVARADIVALRVGAVRDVLAETRRSRAYDSRAFRSLVLAAAAVSSDVVEAWTREEPDNPDALLLYARVATHRAVTATQGRETLEEIAARACAAAHRACPEDPTPFVVELSLWRLRQSAGESAPSRPPGAAGESADASDAEADPADSDPAWSLWRQADERDPGNREAGQRMLALCYPRHGGSLALATDAAAYLASVGPPDGVNRLLPLLVNLEQGEHVERAEPDTQRISKIHQLLGNLAGPGAEPQAEQRRRTLLEMLDLELRGEPIAGPVAEDLATEWFGDDNRPPAAATVSDLSVLVEALHRAERPGLAWKVLRHIHPYASPFPWSRHGPPEKVLARVYRDCRRG